MDWAQCGRSLLEAQGLATKVVAVHGGREPALHDLRDILEVLAEEVRAPGRPVEARHADLGALLTEARRLTNGFRPPEWACRSLVRLHAILAELDRTFTHASSAPVSGLEGNAH